MKNIFKIGIWIICSIVGIALYHSIYNFAYTKGYEKGRVYEIEYVSNKTDSIIDMRLQVYEVTHYNLIITRKCK